jgi:hypothetical protein
MTSATARTWGFALKLTAAAAATVFVIYAVLLLLAR